MFHAYHQPHAGACGSRRTPVRSADAGMASARTPIHHRTNSGGSKPRPGARCAKGHLRLHSAPGAREAATPDRAPAASPSAGPAGARAGGRRQRLRAQLRRPGTAPRNPARRAAGRAPRARARRGPSGADRADHAARTGYQAPRRRPADRPRAHRPADLDRGLDRRLTPPGNRSQPASDDGRWWRTV